MTVSRGNLQGGVQGSEVSLFMPQTEVGDVLSIFLTQENASTTSWLLMIRVLTDDGGFEIAGQVRTFPPNAGEPASRCVGWAYIPGAKGWAITGYGRNADGTVAPANERAFVTLASSKSSGGEEAGVHSVMQRTADPYGRRTFVREQDIAVSGASEALPGSTLWGFAAYLHEEVAGAFTWVQTFDTPVAPLPGASPFWSAPLGQFAAGSPPNPGTAIMPLSVLGRRLVNGLWVSTSTSGDILTPDPAHHLEILTELSQGGL